MWDEGEGQERNDSLAGFSGLQGKKKEQRTKRDMKKVKFFYFFTFFEEKRHLRSPPLADAIQLVYTNYTNALRKE